MRSFHEFTGTINHSWLINQSARIDRGYNTVARRYEFYVLATRTQNSYLRANVLCSFYYINILMTAFLTFRRFPTTFRRFPKIFKIVPKARRTFPNIFREFPKNSLRCPKISEDSRRLSWKIRRCFDDTPTNLSTIKETKLISEKLSISSREIIVILHVKIYGFSQWQKS